MQLENSGGTADGTTVNVTSGHAEVGNDPVDFTLLLRNPVSTVDFSGKAKGRFTLDNIRQFVKLEPGTSISGVLNADLVFNGSKEAIDKKAYDQINTTGIILLNNTTYISKDYPEGVKIRNAQLNFNPKNVALNSLDAIFKNTHLTANGVLDNLIGYALEKGQLQGTVNLTADKVNLNDWMGTDTVTTTQTTSSQPFQVPENINITLNAKADAVQYDKVTYKNVKGTLQLKDETVYLQNVQTEALGGSMAVNGSYSTKTNKTNPDVTLSYDVRDVDIKQAFFAYNTVQKLMPAGKFIAGRLTSQMNMSGKLNGAMMPDLTTLTGKGNLLLIHGVLDKFVPLEKLAAALNVNDLKTINLKDLKSHFEFSNGKVLVKPFDFKVKDIDLQVGGMHGFDQSLDYIIGMKVPRRYFGESGNALVNNLATKATARGIPVHVSETVDLNVKMQGTITSPVVKADLKEAAGDVTKELKEQAQVFVKQKVDSTKQTLKDSLRTVKKQVTDDIRGEVNRRVFGPKDSTQKPLTLDSTKQKATETIKRTIGDLFKKKKVTTDTAK